MKNLLQDLRYGIRIFIRKPAFTSVVLLTLGLGIGAITTIFSIINAVLIRPLPYKDSERLVMIWDVNAGKGVRQDQVSPGNLSDLRDQSGVFEEVAAFASTNFTLTGTDETEKISGAQIAANLLPALGVRPIKGRPFVDEDDQPGRDQVVLVGHGLWKRRFGSDPDLVGKRLQLDNKSYEVIGIMPPGFDFPKWLEAVGTSNSPRGELWTPLALDGRLAALRGARYLSALARLRPGVTPAQAQGAIEPIALDLQQFVENQGYTVAVVPLREQVVGKIKLPLLIFFGAVGFVLLIVCANVANLFLVRATTRQKETAIRAALGCSRARLIRQSLTESVLLGVAGGLAGLLLAFWGIGFIVSSFPEGFPRSNEIEIDAGVFGFTLLISVLTGLFFGTIPALRTARADLNDFLKEGGRSSGEGLTRNRTRSLLVVSEVALAMVLLVGAGLLIRSFIRLTSVETGFNTKNVVAMRVVLPSSKYGQPHQRSAFFEQLLSRVESLPGVESVATTTNLPLSGTNMSFRFMIEGRPAPPTEILLAQYHSISPAYFRTMGTQLLDGRDFTERDTAQTQPVVIINETLAKRYFGDEDPIGKLLKITYGKPVPRQIVGVIRDVKHKGLEFESQEELYVPLSQNPWAFMTVVARTSSDPIAMAPALRSEVWAMDRDQPIDSIKTVEQLVADSVSRPRFYAWLLGLFAALSLILAALGLYGVIAYSVTQRTHEIGVRMALGAQQRDVITLVVKQGLVLSLAGIVIGLAASFGLTRLMSTLVFGVTVTDPVTFVAVSLLLVGIALVASYIPARHAAKVDPTVALRYE